MITIKADSVHKIYQSGFLGRNRNHALQGVSLDVHKGEIFGLLGTNGAGKTTLLNIFSGQLVADSGYVEVLGRDITKHIPRDLKEELNMCSGSPNFPWSLTVQENLKFYSLLYGKCDKRRKDVVNDCIKMFSLEKYRNIRYDQLSSGNKQKLALAKSLINDPKILFLDEPTIGLDPDIAKKIRELVIKIRSERDITIILTTHYMKEAEELCDRIAFVKDGKIHATGTRDEIVARTGGHNLEEAFIELAE